MFRGMKVLTGAAFVVLLLALAGPAARAATPTFIEDANGKRVLTLDSPEIKKPYRELAESASGKVVLYVHENNQIFTDYHKEPVLVVDDRRIRPTPTGLIFASFDGENVVHGRAGKTVMNYHHPDLSPDHASNRVFRVNGPKLTPVELVAVLYALKPEGFKLTDEEVASQKKDIAEAEAEEAKNAAADPVAGKWMILNGSGPVEKTGKGLITIGPKKGDAYPLTYDCTKGGGPTWTGVAFWKELKSDKVLWAAYGSPKTIGLCVYEIKGGTLSGKWYPFYIDGDAKNVGTEDLQGPETLDGDYKITSAKAPNTGAAYSGTVSIHPANIVGEPDQAKSYLITWNLGGAKIQGIGVRTKNYLIVSSGAGADVNIAKFDIQNGGIISGDWYKLGSKEKGLAAATLQN